MRAELRRIALSLTFGQSPRCCALLNHLVRNEGNQKYLNELVIPAISGRSIRPTAGFESAGSLAGAVQLARLRNKLCDYYAGEGQGSALRFRVPDEGYHVSIDVIDAAAAAASLLR